MDDVGCETDGAGDLTGDGISKSDWLYSVFNGVDGGKESNLESLSFFVDRRDFVGDSLLGVLFVALSDENEVAVEDVGGLDNVSLLTVRSCWVCDGSESSLALQWGRWPFSLLNVLPQYGHTPVRNTTNKTIIVMFANL